MTSPTQPPSAPDPAEPAEVADGVTSAAGTEAPGPEAPEAQPVRLMTMEEYNEAIVPRGQLARARGLAAPYIPGGRDPDIVATKRAERPYLRLLALMVIVIVGGGFLITIAGFVAGGK